jgi:nitronate monooxygenase
MEHSIWWTGVSTGLVNYFPSVAKLVPRIASDAEKIILEHLSGLPH